MPLKESQVSLEKGLSGSPGGGSPLLVTVVAVTRGSWAGASWGLGAILIRPAVHIHFRWPQGGESRLDGVPASVAIFPHSPPCPRSFLPPPHPALAFPYRLFEKKRSFCLEGAWAESK